MRVVQLLPDLEGSLRDGNFQSPIANNARDRKLNPGLGYLGRYREATALLVKVKNTGTTIKVELNPRERKVDLSYGGQPITLQEFHFHTPAEHKLDIWLVPCHNFAVAELHLVHKNAAGKLIVVAVPIYVGKSNAGLAALKAAGAIQKCNSITSRLSPEALASLLPPVTGRYIAYEGSLTTPECAQGVIFLLMNDGISATQAELDYIKVVYNARPVQRNSNPVTFRVAQPGE